MALNNKFSPIFSYFACSDVGRKRKENQDNFGIINKGKWFLALVCDGMGGASGGDIASEIAVNVVLDTFKDHKKSPSIDDLRNAVLNANEKIFKFGSENPSKKGLGTTLSLVLLNEKGLNVVHVGDSRVVLFNKGVIRQITTDHTWANELKESGDFDEELTDSSPMTHILSRSLGVGKDLILDESGPIKVEKGDQLIICSDGLHNYISGEDLIPYFKVKNESDNRKIVDSLVEAALTAGGADNITVVSLSILDEIKTLTLQEDLDLVEVGRKSIKTSSDKEATSSDGEQDYFKINHDEIASRVIPEREYSNSSSPFSSFLLGAIFAALVGCFVWFVRPSVSTNNADTGKIGQQNSVMSKLLAKEFNIGSIAVYGPKFSFSLGDFYRYLKLKEDQILNPPRTSVEFKGTKTHEEFDEPNRPIVWENEAKRVDIIKRDIGRNFDELEESSEIENSIRKKILGEDEPSKIFSLNEKSLLREQIFDQNEKLHQLNLTTKEDVQGYILKLKETDQRISEELGEAERFEVNILGKKKSLIRMKEIFSGKSSLAREQLAARLLSYDPSFEPMIRRIRLLRESRDYYANLVNKVTSSEDVILKLTSSQRELAQAEENFDADLKRVLMIIENEYAAYVAGVNYTKKLLNIERSRTQRAIGFAEAYSPLSSERREALFNKTAKEKIDFLKKYSEYERNIPTEIESKRYLRKIYLEEKKSLEL